MNSLILTLTPLFIAMGVPSDAIDAAFDKFMELHAAEPLPDKPSVLMAQAKKVIDLL